MMGSGNIVHNLRLYDRNPDTPPNPSALRFRREVQARLDQRDHQGLIDYMAIGPEAQLAAPTPDHFLPLLYIAALQRDGESPAYLTEVTEGGGLDMTSVVFGG